MSWETQPKRVKAPYLKQPSSMSIVLSTARHEEPCRKQPGPSGKAKYSLVIDSEPVP